MPSCNKASTGVVSIHVCLLLPNTCCKQAAVLCCADTAQNVCDTPKAIPAVSKVCGHMPQEHPQLYTLLRLDLRLWLLLLLRALIGPFLIG